MMTANVNTAGPRGDLSPAQRRKAKKIQSETTVDRQGTVVADLEVLSRLLDSRWSIPGTPIRFGLDAVVGLVPILGDSASALISVYILTRARALGVERALLGRMIANVLLDTLIGSVPLLGSVFDIYFKANNRNMRLLRRHLDRSADPWP
ncbi:DUF4112 domain-containing protein [Mesorhizobium sp. 10J20-29]